MDLIYSICISVLIQNLHIVFVYGKLWPLCALQIAFISEFMQARESRIFLGIGGQPTLAVLISQVIGIKHSLRSKVIDGSV